MTNRKILSLLFAFLGAATILAAQEAVDPGAEAIDREAVLEEIAELEARLTAEDTDPAELHLIEKQIARNYLAINDFAEAARRMERSISLQEEPPVNEFLAIGQLLIDQDKAKRAVRFLRQGQRLHPDSLDLAFLLTYPLSELEKWEEAVKQYEKIEALTGDLPQGLNDIFYFRYGAASERSGKIDQAAQLFQKSLERIPESPEKDELRATVLNYLGYMWLENDMNIDVAGELIKRAVTLEPDSGAIADSLGWYYFKKGRYIEAMNELVRAETLMEEDDAVVMDHIAQTYYQIGKVDRAIEYMERALAVDPENEELQKRLEDYRAE